MRNSIQAPIASSATKAATARTHRVARGQPGRQVDPDTFVGETGRRVEVDEGSPLGRGEPGLFLELAGGGDVRRFTAEV